MCQALLDLLHTKKEKARSLNEEFSLTDILGKK